MTFYHNFLRDEFCFIIENNVKNYAMKFWFIKGKVTFVISRSANISTKQAAENKGTPPINSMLSLTPAGRAVQMGNMAYESGLLNQPQN